MFEIPKCREYMVNDKSSFSFLNHKSQTQEITISYHFSQILQENVNVDKDILMLVGTIVT
jgi:hypothetical protein